MSKEKLFEYYLLKNPSLVNQLVDGKVIKKEYAMWRIEMNLPQDTINPDRLLKTRRV